MSLVVGAARTSQINPRLPAWIGYCPVVSKLDLEKPIKLPELSSGEVKAKSTLHEIKNKIMSTCKGFVDFFTSPPPEINIERAATSINEHLDSSLSAKELEAIVKLERHMNSLPGGDYNSHEDMIRIIDIANFHCPTFLKNLISLFKRGNETFIYHEYTHRLQHRANNSLTDEEREKIRKELEILLPKLFKDKSNDTIGQFVDQYIRDPYEIEARIVGAYVVLKDTEKELNDLGKITQQNEEEAKKLIKKAKIYREEIILNILLAEVQTLKHSDVPKHEVAKLERQLLGEAYNGNARKTITGGYIKDSHRANQVINILSLIKSIFW